jgi:hypothetical protein
MNDHAKLIEEFVASFEFVARDLTFSEVIDPVAAQLVAGGVDAFGRRQWRPLKVQTDRSALDTIYAKLPARFPPLYEELLLAYRWADVDLEILTLLANPPGESLTNLLCAIQGDPHLTPDLTKKGYMQFARATGGHYDPVCFDISSRKNRDYRIVQIDHEEIFCNYRIKVVRQVASSFRALVLETIERAEGRRKEPT